MTQEETHQQSLGSGVQLGHLKVPTYLQGEETAGVVGGKNHVGQGKRTRNVFPSCEVGIISDTECGEDEEVMYVHAHRDLWFSRMS